MDLVARRELSRADIFINLECQQEPYQVVNHES